MQLVLDAGEGADIIILVVLGVRQLEQAAMVCGVVEAVGAVGVILAEQVAMVL